MPGKEGDHPAEVRRLQILKILLFTSGARNVIIIKQKESDRERMKTAGQRSLSSGRG